MRALPTREGFTLIEVLITVVIVGILAMIAVTQFWNTKNRGLEATLQADLRTFAVQQETYYENNRRYAASPAQMPDYDGSPGVELTVTYVGNDGWAARTTHPSIPSSACGLYTGGAPPANGAPATSPGVVQCTRE